MKLNKGDWVEYTSSGFVEVFEGKMIRSDHSDNLRKGIVVGEEGDQVQVLYTGDSSPVWVDAASLEKIEANKRNLCP